MISNDFIKLYEELSELNEAKEDIQRLIDFAGQELADRFLAVKPKLKAPENDLYYWIKKHSVDELESAVVAAENSVSKTQTKKDIADAGAKLVCDTSHWKVYEITTFEASQKYGRDTRWCITGVNDYGDEFWNKYTDRGIEFYFLITKGKYDPRGNDSKIALAVYPNKLDIEVFNQQDVPITITAIPHYEEIDIPGLDLKTICNNLRCHLCRKTLSAEDSTPGPNGHTYCPSCFNRDFYKCATCGRPEYLSLYFFEDPDCNKYCLNCDTEASNRVIDEVIGEFMDKVNDHYAKGVKDIKDIEQPFKYNIRSSDPFIRYEGIQPSPERLIARLKAVTQLLPIPVYKVNLYITSMLTGEIVFDAKGLTPRNIAAAKTAMDNFE
jgi:hypothetical protein